MYGIYFDIDNFHVTLELNGLHINARWMHIQGIYCFLFAMHALVMEAFISILVPEMRNISEDEMNVKA